jgi:bacillopeptidase F
MWDLGYTGRGRTVYIYDSGVWADHPSFEDRFLGNFRPLEQSWYGLFYPEPTGFLSDHGTHVLGTVAGLAEATQDTIGAAFGAYWMACDLINASTAAALPPLANLIAAFQWALNPDGDTATSFDVPDVINNSWRWRDNPDTVQCGGFVVQLMNAIEAAGIANVFAGGNFGPNNAGVNAPQRINTSEVNTFSVGSVDGNQAFPYPISNFSSRGPTQCPGTGSLKIHPEVVAPGQNVRSAWGRDSYNVISGTSMATPHVSGAVLLLKEAFPQLTGEQILRALYQSAVDLGPVGEDNTYGRGMIDVYAAFQLLNSSYTAEDPNAVAWDVSVKDFSVPYLQDFNCQSVLIPYLILENRGDSLINGLEVDLYDNGNLQWATGQWSYPNFSLASGQTDTLFLTGQVLGSLSLGANEFEVRVRIPGVTEKDSINNRRFLLLLANDDKGPTWQLDSLSTWPGNEQALRLPYANYQPRASQKDAFWLGVLELPQDTSVKLSFDLAYQQYGPIRSLQDTFRVWLGRGCAQNGFSDLLLELSGADLATVNNYGIDFTPQSKNDWRRERIALGDYAGESVVISFEGTNRNGNNLYLDNIAVYTGPWDPLHLQESEAPSIRVFPNPTEGLIQVESEGNSNLNWRLYDLSGRMMLAGELRAKGGVIDASTLQSGLFKLILEQDQIRHTRLLLRR